ncbi:MAG: heat-inducible transcriptional repressor HrcA [Alphaproteobacteria bacterium]|nr:MAG: heat-inducible transcriptional repressor HrcA [Alphaproteobacteria bacterium]
MSLTSLESLNARSREIFRLIVENYLETGEPVGSRTLSQALPISLSAASIRNVMSDLERLGLLTSPHASAGRLPSQSGLRLFVDGLLEVGDLAREERESIESEIAARGRNFDEILREATTRLSGLSRCAGLVVTPKHEGTIKHIEFVPTGTGRALVVLVFEDGSVENRLASLPQGVTPSSLIQAANFLTTKFAGKTLTQAKAEIEKELAAQRATLDALSQEAVRAGMAVWSGAGEGSDRSLIVRGQANLLEDMAAAEDLERIRMLFEDLEKQNELMQLLDLAERGDGVKIFIGSETNLFSLSGSSVVVSPYMDHEQKIVGVVGVIGPTRLNYARIIPMVDFTAKTIGRLLG